MSEVQQVVLGMAVLTLIQFWLWLYGFGKMGKRLKQIEAAYEKLSNNRGGSLESSQANPPHTG